MPYIEQKNRFLINNEIAKLIQHCKNHGDLNYTITRLLHEWLKNSDVRISYESLQGCIGVLECVKLELYRMVISPYEEKKIEENGLVSDVDGRFNPEKHSSGT